MLSRLIVGLLGTIAGAASALAADVGVTGNSIKVGILGSLTGPAAIWGSGNLAGATLAFEEANKAGGINGRKLEFVSLDDETSAPKGIAAFTRLVESDEVFAIFGPTSTGVGVPLMEPIKESGIPVFISIFSAPKITEPPIRNIFRAGIINDRMQGRAMANYLVKTRGLKRIAVLRQSDDYGANGGKSVASKLSELGVAAVADEVFNATDTDFTAQVLRLRDAKPDGVIIYGYPAAAAVLTRQIRELGMDAKIIGSSASAIQNYPAMVGPAAKGLEVVSPILALPEENSEVMNKLRKSFQDRFPDLARQGRPTVSDILGYGGALSFIEGLRRAGPDISREKFISALETLDGFKSGVTTPTYFGKDRREGNTSMYIMRIKDDLSREVDPNPIPAE